MSNINRVSKLILSYKVTSQTSNKIKDIIKRYKENLGKRAYHEQCLLTRLAAVAIITEEQSLGIYNPEYWLKDGVL